MFYNDSTNSYDFIRTKDWKRWFAWKPTVIKDKTVWLEFVYRRGYRIDLRTHLIGREPMVGKWQWEYADDLFEILAKSDDPFPPEHALNSMQRPSAPPPPPWPKGSSVSSFPVPPPRTPPPPPRILKF